MKQSNLSSNGLACLTQYHDVFVFHLMLNFLGHSDMPFYGQLYQMHEADCRTLCVYHQTGQRTQTGTLVKCWHIATTLPKGWRTGQGTNKQTDSKLGRKWGFWTILSSKSLLSRTLLLKICNDFLKFSIVICRWKLSIDSDYVSAWTDDKNRQITSFNVSAWSMAIMLPYTDSKFQNKSWNLLLMGQRTVVSHSWKKSHLGTVWRFVWQSGSIVNPLCKSRECVLNQLVENVLEWPDTIDIK